MRRVVLSVALIVALCAPSPVAAWQRFLSPLRDETEYLLDPQVDADGNVTVAATFSGGSGRDFLIASLAGADGTIRWRRQSSGGVTANFLFGMVTDRRGDVVVGGFTDGASDACQTCRDRQAVWKLDGRSGTTIWEAEPAEGTVRAVAMDGAGDVFVARLNENGSVAKLSGSDGTLRWRFDVASVAYRWSLAVDGRGDVAVGADSTLTMLAGLDGHVRWQQASGEIERLAVLPDDDVITLERTYASLSWGDRYVVRRHGVTGDEMWRKPYVVTWYLDPLMLALGPDEAIFVSGGYFGDEQPWPLGRGLFVARLDRATGQEQWRHDIASPGGDGTLVGLGTDERGNAVVHWWDFESGFHLSDVRGDGSGEAWRREVDTFGGPSRIHVSPTGTLVLARGDEGIAVDTRSAATGSLLPCGNGRVDAGEECDDGNAVNGDGCDANCTTSRCGNGEVGCAEECDDGNGDGGDGCSPGCVAERSCGPVDLRGVWDFRVGCDFGFFGSFEYAQRVELTQDCQDAAVTVEEITGCDIRLARWPTAGFACETTPVPLVGGIDGLELRTPAVGAIHTTLTSPVAIPVTPSCSFTQVAVEAVLPGRIYQRYPGRGSGVSGTVAGTYRLGGPGSESCSSAAQLPCNFSLSLFEAPPFAPDRAERARYAAAESSVLAAQYQCASELPHACTRIRSRVVRWIDRARRSLERATRALSDGSDRSRRMLRRTSRALDVVEMLCTPGRHAERDHANCTEDFDLSVRALHQRLEALRQDLAPAS